MKNKKSLKNLKQYCKNRVRFTFYVKFRPVAQKVFFVPALVYIVFLGVTDWYDKKWDGWNIINETNAEIVDILSSSASFTGAPVSEPKGIPVSVMAETKIQGSAGSPVAPRVEVIEKIRKAFPGEENVAVAIAKCESSLDPKRIGDTHMKYPSIGLFQINQTWHKYPTEQLQNADENIRIAKEIKERWGNWNAWSCWKFGLYEKHLATK